MLAAGDETFGPEDDIKYYQIRFGMVAAGDENFGLEPINIISSNSIRNGRRRRRKFWPRDDKYYYYYQIWFEMLDADDENFDLDWDKCHQIRFKMLAIRKNSSMLLFFWVSINSKNRCTPLATISTSLTPLDLTLLICFIAPIYCNRIPCTFVDENRPTCNPSIAFMT